MHTDKMVFGLRRLLRPNVTFGVVFGKDVFLGQMEFLECVENYVFGICASGMLHAFCLSSMSFYLVVFGFYLPAVPFLVP